MAEQQGAPFQFFKQNQKAPTNSSRDYTGEGYAIYSNGEQYNGEYQNGIRQGKGKYIYANGDKYQGQFKNNKKHGVGRLTYKDKGEYYGQWENGVKHGQGTYVYVNGDSYSGNWQFGVKNGQGTYLYKSDGNRLIGQWKQNKIQTGKWIFTNGALYEGSFKDNKPDGQGKWILPNGNQLHGQYKQIVTASQDAEENKVNTKLEWQSKIGLVESAERVNQHQIF